MRLVLLSLLAIPFTVGCGDDGDTKSDSDWNTDADGDVEPDGDADADGADADSGTDTDTDGDADADGADADSGTDTGTDTGSPDADVDSDVAHSHDTGAEGPDGHADADDGDVFVPDYTIGPTEWDGAMSAPGDTITISFTTHNNTGEDDCEYPTVSLETEADWFEISPPDWTFYCIMVDEPAETTFTFTMTEARPVGTPATARWVVSRLHCDTETSSTACPTHEDVYFGFEVTEPPVSEPDGGTTDGGATDDGATDDGADAPFCSDSDT